MGTRRSRHSKKITTCLTMVLMLSCLFVPLGWSDGNYFSRSGEKFGRGATNVVFSPLEILKSMERGLEMDQAYRAVLIGPFRGIFNMIGHAFVGTYEMVTFWIPQDPILKPTYVYPGLKEYLHEKNDPRVDAPP